MTTVKLTRRTPRQRQCYWLPTPPDRYAAASAAFFSILLLLSSLSFHRRSPSQSRHQPNRYALSPGELPGYTGWARPEQTLAGYFEATSLSHLILPRESRARHQSIVESGEKFSFLLTCDSGSDGHGGSAGGGSEAESDPPLAYKCPPGGGSLFYVRAYGPSVVTGDAVDHRNASYSFSMRFADPGEYTLEVVVTFSAPPDFNELPLNSEQAAGSDDGGEERREPGYEGYMVSGFPISILVTEPEWTTQPAAAKGDRRKPWCTLDELTETSPRSALYKGRWKIIDNVARLPHQPLTPDETSVSLDGYRMGLNSVGVRMGYEYTDCDLIHINDIRGGISGGMDKCLLEFSPLARTWTENDEVKPGFEGVHVIFIGDSVMKLVKGFFDKIVNGSFGIKVTFLETNGGIHHTMTNVTSSLEEIQRRQLDRNISTVLIANTGLHDIDILCSSKRKRTRDTNNVLSMGESCSDAYREAMVQLVCVLDEFPAQLKVFRTTTAGWQKYGNYGFSWSATDMQPLSRSSHTVHHFNTIAYDVILNGSDSILISDGYWITLPRPDHTQTSLQNKVGKHLVHPGFEVLSVFARRWFMLVLWGLCGDSFDSCLRCIGGYGK